MLGSPYFWSFPEITNTNYGLGWFTDMYRDTRMVSHGGNTLGFSSLMTLLPEKSFGVVLLGNGNSNFMIYPLTYMILDDVLGVEGGHWNERFQTTIGGIFAAMAEGQKAMAAMQIPGPRPLIPWKSTPGASPTPPSGRWRCSAMTVSLPER